MDEGKGGIANDKSAMATPASWAMALPASSPNGHREKVAGHCSLTAKMIMWIAGMMRV